MYDIEMTSLYEVWTKTYVIELEFVSTSVKKIVFDRVATSDWFSGRVCVNGSEVCSSRGWGAIKVISMTYMARIVWVEVDG